MANKCAHYTHTWFLHLICLKTLSIYNQIMQFLGQSCCIQYKTYNCTVNKFDTYKERLKFMFFSSLFLVFKRKINFKIRKWFLHAEKSSLRKLCDLKKTEKHILKENSFFHQHSWRLGSSTKTWPDSCSSNFTNSTR